MIIELSPELEERVRKWGLASNRPGEELAVELLQEYFDDCDDADRLKALIQAGKMEIIPVSVVHNELEEFATISTSNSSNAMFMIK